ncbi:MAG: hypothetical protein NTV22_01810 [bacterium]|nr:hypothetical protein [bacterium]
MSNDEEKATEKDEEPRMNANPAKILASIREYSRLLFLYWMFDCIST